MAKNSQTFFPRITLPSFTLPKTLQIKDYRLADTFYDRLRQHIDATQKQLERNEQLAVCYYSLGGECILVDDIGYHNPNLIMLYGRDSQGNECNVIAHMQSLHLLLRVLKIEDGKERKQIGFVSGK